jgi:PAS domain S-box-containing protein
MKGKHPQSRDALRRRAEQKLSTKKPPKNRSMSKADRHALLHELQVHEIELEIQNEELQKAQAETQESLDRFTELFDFAPIAYFVLDQSGLVQAVNLAGGSLLGLACSQVVKQPFEQYLLPAYRLVFTGFCQAVMKDKSRRTCELVLLKHGDGLCDVLVEAVSTKAEAGEAQGCRLAVTDITARKQAEAALQQAEAELEVRVHDRTTDLEQVNDQLRREIAERRRAEEASRESQILLRAVMEGTGDPVYVKDRESRILLGNPALAKVVGKPIEEIVGRTDSEHYGNAAVGQALREHDLRVMESGASELMEETVPTPEGDRTFLSNKAPYRDASGGIIGIIGISRDITERKQAEQAVQRAAAELARSNEDLDHFASVASHDLQEPLRLVEGYVQLLERRYKGKLDSEADEFIQFMVEAVGRMRMLIKDLLAYARVGTRGEAPAEAPAEPALERAMANLKLAIEDSQTAITHDPLPAVKADPSQLTQLFQNLIGNAIKFRSMEPPRIHVAARLVDGQWRFSVCDNGIGIDPRFAERVFEVFRRLHARDKYPGTGIGLAICKKIVERHGGRIWVESEPGKGSTFCFTLPRAGKI